MDSNAHDPLWNSAYTDQKGAELLDIILNKEFSIANTLLEDLSVIPQNTTFVDVTLAGNNIGDKISNWHYFDLPSLSDLSATNKTSTPLKHSLLHPRDLISVINYDF